MSMFGALNRFISRLDSAPEEKQSDFQNSGGFQVLRITNNEIPLEPWFDFVIGLNGRTLESSDPNLFATELRNCAGTTISVGVFSAKGQRIRELYISVPKDPPTLGLSFQWTPLSAAEDVWHILTVQPNSPADLAGLLPYSDYVIGSPEGLVRGESGLSELVEDYLNRPLRLHVYNHEYNTTRPLTLTPSRTWGGQGALGCTLGFGALHRIPAPLDEPPQGPGETLFDTSSSPALPPPQASGSPFPSAPAGTEDGRFETATTGQAAEFLVPANLATPPPGPPKSTSPAPGAGAGGRAKKARAHHGAATGGLDDYFAEGEAKSREIDHAPTGKAGGGGVPPPPPVGAKGGPPMGKGGPPKAVGDDVGGEKEGGEGEGEDEGEKKGESEA